MKVFLQAYTRGNLGDDLFVHILCRRYPEVEFWTLGEKAYRRYYRDIPNLVYLVTDSFFRNVIYKYHEVYSKIFHRRIADRDELLRDRILHRFERCVIMGGSIFMQRGKMKYGVESRKSLYEKETYVLGCNFGPYEDPAFRDACEQLFRKAKDVCFRDRYSYQLFSKLENTRVNPDIVLGMDIPRVEKKDYFIISVVDPRKHGKSKGCCQNYISGLASLADAFGERGEKVFFFSFCDAEGDMDVIREILLHTHYANAEKIQYRDMGEALQIIGGSRGMIASRFHAVILALRFQIPVFPVYYSDKTRHVLEDLQYDGDMEKIERLSEVNIWRVLKALEQPQHVCCDFGQAAEQFAALDQVFLSL